MERTETVALPASKKRIVVLGDPHGDLLALMEVLEREDRPEVQIFSAGDNIGYTDGPTSSELVRLLAEKKIPSVQGNHEAWSPTGRLFLPAPPGPPDLTPEAHAWCQALPLRIRIEAAAAPDLKLTLLHTLPGTDWDYVSPDNARGFLAEEDCDVIFSGHTHRPAIYSIGEENVAVETASLSPKKSPLRVSLAAGKRYIADAGSLARPSQGFRSQLEKGSYAALDLERRVLEIHAFSKKEKLEQLMKQLVEENTRKAREATEPPPPPPP